MLEWSGELRIGVDELDRQHQEVFNHMNALDKAMREGKGKSEIVGMLDFLEGHVEKDFHDEEAAMLEFGYPDLSAHAAHHLTFLRDFLALKAEFAKRGPSPSMVIETQSRVINWVTNHIKNVDKRFALYMRKRGTPTLKSG